MADDDASPLLYFADILAESGSQDLADTLAAYQAKCDQLIAQKGIVTTSSDDVWTLERNTWQLVEALLRVRMNTSGVDDMMDEEEEEEVLAAAARTDADIVADLHTNDPQVSEYVAVKEWLEQIAPPSLDTVEVKRRMYACTLRELEAAANRGISANSRMVTQLDPDGCLRTQAPLHPDDAKHEVAMLKCAFKLMRRGEMDKALELYRACNQHWRAVSLSGGMYYSRRKDGPTGEMISSGNRNRGLWRMTCCQIANEPSVNVYERAQYAVLCGNATNILPACETYEDHMWAYFTALAFNVTEQRLDQAPRIKSADHFDFEVPEFDKMEPAAILDKIATLPDNIATSRPSLVFFRKVQAALIVRERWPALLEELADSIELIDFKLHRFIVHLLLLLRDARQPVAGDENGSGAGFNDICSAFVDVLIRRGDVNGLVPVYVCHLPYQLQVEKHATFLRGLRADYAERQEVLRQAHQFGLDVKAITLCAVRGLFESLEVDHQQMNSRTELSFSSWQPDQAVAESDLSLIRALHWLMIERDQGLDALLCCNALYRRFWLGGKLNAVKALRKSLQEDARYFSSQPFNDSLRAQFAGDACELFIREQVHHNLLLSAMLTYDSWRTCRQSRPGRSQPTEWARWSGEMRKVTAQLQQELTDLLGTQDSLSWMEQEDDVDVTIVDQADLDARSGDIMKMRRAYIPELSLLLQQCLFETRDFISGNLDRSIDLAYHIAEPNRSLFSLFEAGEGESGAASLQDFLGSIADSVLEKLDAGRSRA